MNRASEDFFTRSRGRLSWRQHVPCPCILCTRCGNFGFDFLLVGPPRLDQWLNEALRYARCACKSIDSHHVAAIHGPRPASHRWTVAVKVESRDAKPLPKMAVDRYASLRCSEQAVAWAKSFKSEAAKRNMIVAASPWGYVRTEGNIR
jgi:hypothetical protein